MKYDSSEEINNMSQEVASYNSLAKRMLKADDVKKMLVRFKNSEFSLIDDEKKITEDLQDINVNQSKPLEFWIIRAAAQLVIQRKQEENKKKQEIINQAAMLNINPVNSIINDDIIISDKGVNETGIVSNVHLKSDNKKNSFPILFNGVKNNQNGKSKEIGTAQNYKELGLNNGGGVGGNNNLYAGGSSNNNIFGPPIGSGQQNSTLPYSSNIPQLGSNKSNDFSGNQYLGSNIFNSNIQNINNNTNNNNTNGINYNNINQNLSEEHFMQPLQSPNSNYDFLNPTSERKSDKNDELIHSPSYQTFINTNKFLNGTINHPQNNNNIVFQNKEESHLTPHKELQNEGIIPSNTNISELNETQRNGQKSIDKGERISISKKKRSKSGNTKNPEISSIQNSKNNSNHKNNSNSKINNKINNNNNNTQNNNNNIDYNKTQKIQKTTAGGINQKTQKSNLTNQDQNEIELNNIPKRNFTIEHFRGVLFIKKKNEVFRKVTIGSFMEGDDIFVILSIEKDYLVLEKKISQLRELLNLYESLYLYCLKCLKNLTYDAYLDIPKMDEDEQVKNNFEGLWNKNNLLHLQLKVIINKIMNMKDVINLQKPIRTPLYVEEIDINNLFIELISDFKPILEEKNITVQVQNLKQISTIINSHKRVKQVLFNIFCNAIKNTKKNYSVQVLIDYYMDNKKIVQFHIINMIENMQNIPKDDSSTKLDIKEILKSAQKSQTKKKKKDRRKNNNIIQVGLRVSNKILTFIGPKSGLIMKKVDGTFQTQFHVYSDASYEAKNEKTIKKENKEKQDDENIMQDSWIQKMEIYQQQQRIFNMERDIDCDNKLKLYANKSDTEH